MIREILTLVSENTPLQYYIQFDKSRKRFSFEPSYRNKSAPAFTIHVEGSALVTEGEVSPEIERQAKEKILDFLGNMIFDRF